MRPPGAVATTVDAATVMTAGPAAAATSCGAGLRSAEPACPERPGKHRPAPESAQPQAHNAAVRFRALLPRLLGGLRRRVPPDVSTRCQRSRPRGLLDGACPRVGGGVRGSRCRGAGRAGRRRCGGTCGRCACAGSGAWCGPALVRVPLGSGRTAGGAKGPSPSAALRPEAERLHPAAGPNRHPGRSTNRRHQDSPHRTTRRAARPAECSRGGSGGLRLWLLTAPWAAVVASLPGARLSPFRPPPRNRVPHAMRVHPGPGGGQTPSNVR